MVTYQLAAELWHPLQVWSRSWNQIAQLHKVSETACPNIVRSFLSLQLKPFILSCGQNDRKHQTLIGRLHLTNTYKPTDFHHRNMGANKLYFKVHTSTFCSLILLHIYDTCKCFGKLLEMLTACLLLCLTLPEGPTHLQCTRCCHRYITILAGMTVQSVRKESRHKKKPTSMSCRQFPQRLKSQNRLKTLSRSTFSSNKTLWVPDSMSKQGYGWLWTSCGELLNSSNKTTAGKYANHAKAHFWHIFKHLQQQEGGGITTHQFTPPWHMKHGIVNTIPLLLHVDGWVVLKCTAPPDFSPKVLYRW